MGYILITIISLCVAQLLKFVFRYYSKTTDSKKFWWVFIWATGAPSAHSAVLISNLVLLYKDVGFTPNFYFFSLVAIILMYNLVADRERELIRKSDKKVLDISGHSFFDIATGIITGLGVGLLYVIMLK